MAFRWISMGSLQKFQRGVRALRMIPRAAMGINGFLYYYLPNYQVIFDKYHPLIFGACDPIYSLMEAHANPRGSYRLGPLYAGLCYVQRPYSLFATLLAHGAVEKHHTTDPGVPFISVGKLLHHSLSPRDLCIVSAMASISTSWADHPPPIIATDSRMQVKSQQSVSSGVGCALFVCTCIQELRNYNTQARSRESACL